MSRDNARHDAFKGENMALPSSCRVFVARGLCMKRMLSQGARTVCRSALSDCKSPRRHQQLSATSLLRDFRRRRSFKLPRNAPYCSEEAGSERSGYWFPVWSAMGKCIIPPCTAPPPPLTLGPLKGAKTFTHTTCP